MVRLLPSVALIIILYLAVSNGQFESLDDDLKLERELSPSRSNENIKITNIAGPNRIITDVDPELKPDNNGATLITNTNPVNAVTQKEYIYKWKNDENIIIISSEMPPKNIVAEVFIYEKEYNLINKLSNINNNKLITDDNFTPPASLSDNPLKVYTPDGLRELIRYSKDVGKIIELRGELLSDLIEQL